MSAPDHSSLALAWNVPQRDVYAVAVVADIVAVVANAAVTAVAAVAAVAAAAAAVVVAAAAAAAFVVRKPIFVARTLVSMRTFFWADIL